MSTPSTPEDAAIPDPPAAAAAAAAAAVEDDRVYLVPLRWWKEAQESSDEEAVLGIPYTASPAPSSYGNPMRLIGHIFNSDLVFNLKKDEESTPGEVEVGASGRSYALIPADMWASALKWHNDSHLANNNQSSMFADDGMVDVYPLMLKISVMRDANIMTVKITKKDNADNYKRAFKIFSVDSEVVRICDFSGQTNLIFMNEWNKMPQDGRLLDQEILLQIQVYALSESMTCSSEVRKFGSVSNGNIGNAESAFSCSGSFRGIGLGLTGLENLGNTCFMNSSVQCLAHTPKLVEYFLGDYFREINHHNPLGMDGEIALAFGDVLRKLWSSDKSPVCPRVFKSKISHFAPQFSGFNQHDSQELLAFLLDGLHEDMNRVKHKPYVEAKDSCGRPDEEVADEYWGNHLARNDSIIVDVCQGQYRSTLVCPICRKVSVTFDPFMYLSLPLPSSAMRTMTATVFSTDGSLTPSSFTINVPKNGKCKDFIQALSIACSLGDEEYLLVAEVYSGRIIRYLEDPSDQLSLIRDGDRLVAYRLPKDKELSLVVFTSQRMEEHDKNTSRWKAVGVPLITMLPSTGDGSTIRNLYLKLIKPFLKSVDVALHDDGKDKGSDFFSQDVDMDANSHAHSEATPDASEERKQAEGDFQFYLTDEKSQLTHSTIKMDEPLSLTGLDKRLHVLVSWPDKALEEYDLSRLNSLPEIYKSGLFTRRSQEPASLYACLEAFLNEEPLGPEDMWFCPSCKSHQQASKKLDLWRLPEVLVIHLKRFSYSRFLKNKLETFVDFPVHDLDLSSYIARKTGQSHRYMLYAISNHYGSMGGGHYTAYVYNEGQNQWYDFDDSRVFPITESSIKTPAAYVLFYKRVLGSSSDV